MGQPRGQEGHDFFNKVQLCFCTWMMLLVVVLLLYAQAATSLALLNPFAVKSAFNRASCRIPTQVLPHVLQPAAAAATSLSAVVQDSDRASPSFEVQVCLA
jgi:hypothetical protein